MDGSKYSYGKFNITMDNCPFIIDDENADLPIQHGDFPVRSVKLEGKLKLEIPLTSIHFIVLYPP
jgi:hypothetical protein